MVICQPPQGGLNIYNREPARFPNQNNKGRKENEMVVKIIGVESKAGSFTAQQTGQVIDYNNIYLYAVRTLPVVTDGRICSGEVPETIKIKNDSSVIRGVFNRDMSAKDMVEMIGKEYNVYYDNHNKVDMIIPLDPPAGKKGA